METIKIKINKTVYPARFGLKANKILSKIWGFKTVGEVTKKVYSGLSSTKSGDVAFEQYDIIADVTLAGIKAVDEDVNIVSDEIAEVIFKDPSLLTRIIRGYMAEMPKVSPEPKKAKRGQKK